MIAMRSSFVKRKESRKTKIRYAVIGLGHITQVAVLPAFKHANNSEIAALITGDPTKARALSKRYRVNAYRYDDLETALDEDQIDAVYIATPNTLHREHTERAARVGVHVLCEKPMATTEADCNAMMRAAEKNKVKLMIAYRLHFNDANLRAIEIGQGGDLGELRYFNSLFGMQVAAGNIRLRKKLGGGTLYDIGIYCINAARYLFRDEPIEVVGLTANNGQKRFAEVEEMVGALLRFPGERLATFTSSFGSADLGYYELVGTKGWLRLEPAYEYVGELKCLINIGERKTEKTFKRSDQFASELIYFSDCILNNREPEPSGEEGLADVRIINAIYESARTRRPIRIKPVPKSRRPQGKMKIKRPPIKKPKVVKASSPHPE
jgi:glucose-fructose oxidoreductase